MIYCPLKKEEEEKKKLLQEERGKTSSKQIYHSSPGMWLEKNCSALKKKKTAHKVFIMFPKSCVIIPSLAVCVFIYLYAAVCVLDFSVKVRTSPRKHSM